MKHKASLKLIEAKIRALQAKAEKLKTAEKPGVGQVRAVIIKYKLTRADVMAALGKEASNSGLRGKKIKPKYRNPANKGETWAGRGLKPKWVVAALAHGRKLEDLAV